MQRIEMIDSLWRVTRTVQLLLSSNNRYSLSNSGPCEPHTPGIFSL